MIANDVSYYNIEQQYRMSFQRKFVGLSTDLNAQLRTRLMNSLSFHHRNMVGPKN
jgi:hypothetical protein